MDTLALQKLLTEWLVGWARDPRLGPPQMMAETLRAASRGPVLPIGACRCLRSAPLHPDIVGTQFRLGVRGQRSCRRPAPITRCWIRRNIAPARLRDRVCRRVRNSERSSMVRTATRFPDFRRSCAREGNHGLYRAGRSSMSDGSVACRPAGPTKTAGRLHRHAAQKRSVS